MIKVSGHLGRATRGWKPTSQSATKTLSFGLLLTLISKSTAGACRVWIGRKVVLKIKYSSVVLLQLQRSTPGNKDLHIVDL